MRYFEILREGSILHKLYDPDQDFTFLYHGTTRNKLKSILKYGVGDPSSHWGTEEVARYFGPIIFRLPIKRFSPQFFGVDEQMVDFPIFDDYDVRSNAWEDIEEIRTPTWEDSLKVFEAVVYHHPIHVTKDDLL